MAITTSNGVNEVITFSAAWCSVSVSSPPQRLVQVSEVEWWKYLQSDLKNICGLWRLDLIYTSSDVVSTRALMPYIILMLMSGMAHFGYAFTAYLHCYCTTHSNPMLPIKAHNHIFEKLTWKIQRTLYIFLFLLFQTGSSIWLWQNKKTKEHFYRSDPFFGVAFLPTPN